MNYFFLNILLVVSSAIAAPQNALVNRGASTNAAHTLKNNTASTTTSAILKTTSTHSHSVSFTNNTGTVSLSATATLYQNEESSFVTAPATTAPSSGCAIATQQLTTFTQNFTSLTTQIETFSSSLYCTCGNGGSRATSVSINDYGTKYIYCYNGGTKTASSQAAATATPSSDPGSPTNPDWANVSCSYGALSNVLSNPELQWNDSGATAAWNQKVEQWNSANAHQKSYGFSTFLSNALHGPPFWDCADLSSGDCDDSIECGQHSSANADVLAPAGYIIMNSMQVLYSVFNDFYNDITAASDILNSQIPQFTSQFSVVEEQILLTEAQQQRERKAFEIILVVIDSFTLFVGSGIGQEISKDAVAWVTDTAAILQTEISDVFSFEELSFKTDQLIYFQNYLLQFAGTLTETWESTTQKLATSIFSDPSNIWPFIANGHYFVPNNTITSFNATQNLVQAFFANSLAQAWSGGVSVGQAVIIPVPSGFTCGTFPGALDKFFTAADNVYYETPPADIGADTCITYNGTSYWFVIVSEKNVTLTTLPGGPVTPPHQIGPRKIEPAADFLVGESVGSKTILPRAAVPEPTKTVVAPEYNFTVPYGMNGLNGTADIFGGLDISTVYANVLNTWAANDYTNAYMNTTVKNITYNRIESVENADITQYTGLISIPVCTMQELNISAITNPTNYQESPYWPCLSPLDQLLAQNVPAPLP